MWIGAGRVIRGGCFLSLVLSAVSSSKGVALSWLVRTAVSLLRLFRQTSVLVIPHKV